METRALPASEVQFDVRRGTLDDLPWVDAAQKSEREGLGFRFQSELEGHVLAGRLWIATPGSGAGSAPAPAPGSHAAADFADEAGRQAGEQSLCESAPSAKSAVPSLGRIGYCIAKDRYQSRDELGLIVQMYVVPEHRRSLVAANFLSRIWDQWPSGVKLCSCWCAQDLPANRFWERCGFRALAFRTGSRATRFTTYDAEGNPTGKTKGHRIHIYWQKRIHPRKGDAQKGDAQKEDPRKEDGLPDDTSGGNTSGGNTSGGDTSGGGGGGDTPYWYPGQTGGGSLNEARLVFPIPPGSSWKDAKPSILPGVGDLFEALRREREEFERRALLQLAPPPPEDEKPRVTKAEKAAAKAKRVAQRTAADAARAKVARGGLRFAPLPPSGAELKAKESAATAERKRAEAEAVREAKRQAKVASKKMSSKNDPALAGLARELRDRWLDAVQRDPGKLSLGSDQGGPCYDVSRVIGGGGTGRAVKRVESVKRLAA